MAIVYIETNFLMTIATGREAEAMIEKDPTDNLILHCILSHARLHPTEAKAFLSGNVKEFRQLAEVQDALQQAGVEKYFSRTEDFLGWLQSHS